MGDVKYQVGIDHHIRESIPFFSESLEVDRGTPPAYLAKIQQGPHSKSFDAVPFSKEQERNLRNFHLHIERILEK